MGPRRRRHVVEQGAAAREPLDAEELLGVERAVGRAMLGVALGRDVAAGRVEHGPNPLLERCGQSRSSAVGGSGTAGSGVQSDDAGRAGPGRVPKDPHRRASRPHDDPAPDAPPPIGPALQAVLGTLRRAGWGGAQALRLRALPGQPRDLPELHLRLPQEGDDRSGDPDHAPVRRHPRLDGARRAADADGVPRLPGALLRHRVEVDPRAQRPGRQAGRRRDHRPVLRRRQRRRSTPGWVSTRRWT